MKTAADLMTDTARHIRCALLWSLCVASAGGATSASAAAAPQGAPAAFELPAWLYPVNAPATAAVHPDKTRPLKLSGSKRSHTQAELLDLFQAAEWNQFDHGPVPPIVAKGRAPDVYACGYCHTVTGQGRPENAPLAGLPAAFIEQQVAAMRSGQRHSPLASAYVPTDNMNKVAQHASDAEVTAAARYFAAQTLGKRVQVIETDRVPRPVVVGWTWAAAPDGAQEALGQRLLEYSPDPVRHERRDDAMTYTAYVPVGSIERGRQIALRGINDGTTLPCSGCHGPALRGIALIPPLAGRSPSYLLRSMFAFKAGARNGPLAIAMQSECRNLSTEDMIALAAYAASLPP